MSQCMKLHVGSNIGGGGKFFDFWTQVAPSYGGAEGVKIGKFLGESFGLRK